MTNDSFIDSNIEYYFFYYNNFEFAIGMITEYIEIQGDKMKNIFYGLYFC